MRSVTMVGSRDSNVKYEIVMTTIAFFLAKTHRLRSGRAEGPDQWSQVGYIIADMIGQCKGAHIFVPDKNFCSDIHHEYPDQAHWSIETYDEALWQQATAIARDIHPKWLSCSYYAKALHTRNVFQVLGKGLDDASEFCIYCANEYKGEVFGGTRTATVLCDRSNVPKLNIRLNGPKAAKKFFKTFDLDFDYCKSKQELIESLSRLNRR